VNIYVASKYYIIALTSDNQRPSRINRFPQNR
jgi:hypothetical protein